VPLLDDVQFGSHCVEKMVESKVSVYDSKGSIASPSMDDVRQEVIVVEAEPEETSKLMPESAEPASSKDREHIVVAGIGSAVLGMLLCGPIVAILMGCGAAYAAETNAEVRHKVGRVWEQAQDIDKKHRIVERSVKGIGGGVCWLIEKVTSIGKRNIDNETATDIAPPPIAKVTKH
jgi:hypothetical protein